MNIYANTNVVHLCVCVVVAAVFCYALMGSSSS